MFRLLAAVVPALLAAPAALAQPYDHPHMWDYGWGWGMMIFGPVMMIAVVVAIVVVAVVVLRWIGEAPRERGTGTGQPTPLDILKERFARGEIDKQEFEERKRLLSD